MSDIAVAAIHNVLFNGFRVFATLKVSWHQVLWNLQLTQLSPKFYLII